MGKKKKKKRERLTDVWFTHVADPAMHEALQMLQEDK